MADSSINVSNLSDAELVSMLLQHGATCGPIIAQTRRVYEKKLIRLLRGDESMTHDYSDDYEDEEEEDDDEDMDAAGDIAAGDSSWHRTYSSEMPSSRYRPTAGVSSQYEYQSAVYSSADRSSVLTSTHQQQQQQWLPRWLKIVLVLVIILLVYLIVSNMEPAYTPPALDTSI